MDINIVMSNVTPGEFALLIPVMHELEQLRTERQDRYEDFAKARTEAVAEAAKEAWKAEHKEPELPPVEKPEEAPPLQEVPQIDLEVIRKQLSKLKQDKGLDAVKAILQKHGVTKVPDLPAAEYEAVMEEIALCYSEEG